MQFSVFLVTSVPIDDKYFLLTLPTGCFIYTMYISHENTGRTVSLFLAQQTPLPQWARASAFTRFLDHTQRQTTISRTHLDEWSIGRRDLYLTTHNTHNRQTSMPPGGIRTHNLSRRAAEDLRLRPRGHWDRRLIICIYKLEGSFGLRQGSDVLFYAFVSIDT